MYEFIRKLGNLGKTVFNVFGKMNNNYTYNIK